MKMCVKEPVCVGYYTIHWYQTIQNLLKHFSMNIKHYCSKKVIFLIFGRWKKYISENSISNLVWNIIGKEWVVADFETTLSLYPEDCMK